MGIMRRVVVFDASDIAAPEGHQVYADPAGHPFCIGWGHPDDEAVRNILRKTPEP